MDLTLAATPRPELATAPAALARRGGAPLHMARKARHNFGRFKLPRGARVTDWKIHSFRDKDLDEECRRIKRPRLRVKG
jgi:hypothetical protein